MTLTRSDRESFVQSLIAAVVIFSFLLFTAQAYAASVTLSVNVQTSITFVTLSQGFATTSVNITPGTPLMATTTTAVTTNDTNGWFVGIQGTNKTTVNNNLQTAGNTYSIPDQTEWIPGGGGTGTTTPGNAAQISAFTNSGNVLAFRVAASSTNGGAVIANSWWGAQDNYAVTNASTLYAGIPSTTRNIMYTNTGYTAAAHVNDVQYYLNVGPSQATGAYTAPITFTATGN